MKKLLLLANCLLTIAAFSQRDYSSFVNPFIGTGGHGHTYPGAAMPFGMMQLSPDTRLADWDGSSGYHYSDSVIYGFSHTHLSGTGIPDYCDVLMMPFLGEVKWDPIDYRSAFSHKNEKASPGYYEVLLDRQNIKAQLTTSFRSSMHQYSFPQEAKEGAVLIDLKWRDEVLESSIEKVSDYELRGLRRSRSWAQNQSLYFYIKFEKPIKNFTVQQTVNAATNGAITSGKEIRVAVRFDLDASKILRAKVGISGVTEEGAKANLDAEIKDWNFEKVRAEAKNTWNKELSKIDVKGGTTDQQTIFYTALYHTFLSPNIFQDVDGQYRSTDNKIHRSVNTTNYSVFSLWDTYRAYHPLMTIINQQRTFDWIATFLLQYKYGGMLPVWELAGNETFCMIGYHSVPVIWDAYQKGIRGYDPKLVLEAMTSYAESNRFGLDHYRRYGYIPNDKEHESVSKTVEYAYDDWCIAQMAKAIGNDSVYKKYIARAQNYKNVFDPQTKKMRGKVGAMWNKPFDPREINNFYTEGNSWQYSFAAPQDISGIIELYGGKNEFLRYLNELFTTSTQTTGRDQADVTGLIGQYAHGNEPSHHMAYLFNYAGQPQRTQELIHKICNEFYENSPDGLIGNEDCGQMSAWYVLSALGFYPVTPGSGEYAIGTPVFDEATINLENGKKFIIRAKRKNRNSFYVSATSLNGKPSTKSFLSHNAIMQGGSFEFSLTDAPGKSWGTATLDIPATSITENKIVPAPFFQVESNKFKDKAVIQLNHLDPTVEIKYKTANSNFTVYKQPFVLSASDTVMIVASKNGKSSAPVSQVFYKLPSDKTIKVLSKVNPMYTAGGNEVLIDGILGTENWRSGDWQSYFDSDFEAIIDLQKTKPVSYVGVHVLQDVSPWIIFPKELIVYTSTDGENFTEAARIANKSTLEMNGAHTQELGMNLNTTARYIKVKAVNGGKLPTWHESAGSPSHLFIDEVIVR